MDAVRSASIVMSCANVDCQDRFFFLFLAIVHEPRLCRDVLLLYEQYFRKKNSKKKHIFYYCDIIINTIVYSACRALYLTYFPIFSAAPRTAASHPWPHAWPPPAVDKPFLCSPQPWNIRFEELRRCWTSCEQHQHGQLQATSSLCQHPDCCFLRRCWSR